MTFYHACQDSGLRFDRVNIIVQKLTFFTARILKKRGILNKNFVAANNKTNIIRKKYTQIYTKNNEAKNSHKHKTIITLKWPKGEGHNLGGVYFRYIPLVIQNGEHGRVVPHPIKPPVATTHHEVHRPVSV